LTEISTYFATNWS